MVTFRAAGYFDANAHWKAEQQLGGGAMGDMGRLRATGSQIGTGEET